MRARKLFGVLLVAFAAAAARGATFQIVNLDAAGEGFNSLAPRVPVAGNPGLTLGQQRLNVFNAAAAVWGAVLKSNITIRVGSNFDPLFCDSGSAVLGSAGPESFARDFPLRPVAATWYVAAEANAIQGSDLDPGVNDIGAQFNSSLDAGNPGCLGGETWWYGIGAPAPANTVDLFTTVLHELAHGLGFLSGHNLGTGAKLGGFDDAYLRLLRDESFNLSWSAMTNGQRLASQVNTGNLTWTGARANSAVPGFNAGVNAGRLRMYAPNPLEPGSSVSHWDTALSPDELQEPDLASRSRDYATYLLMRDLSWPVGLVFKDSFESGDTDFW